MADWDLNAVVRSCKYATNTATNSATSANIITTPTNTSTPALEDDPLLDWLKSEEVSGDDALYSFPSLLEPRANAFQELEQFYQPFFPNPTTTNNNFSTITNTHVGIIPNSPIISDFGGGSSSGHQQHHLQQQQQQQQHLFLPTNTTTISPPHFNPPGFGGLFRSHQQQVQQVLLPKQENQIHQQGFMRPNQAMNPALPLPRLPLPMHTHTPRSRKRKSQQKRMVCEVTAENLSSDLWAWRKYGQKPIKGSPHPRNYYRCSSSKGCAARKQVERSTTDPDIFVVTYTGDHTHPPPTHRNSLAGSTRNKLSQKQPISKDSVSGSPTAAAANNHSSWSPLSADLELDDDDMENINEDGNGNEDEADVLISNMDAASQEMIIMRLEHLDSSSIGGGGSLAAGASGDSFLDQRPSHLGSSWAAANCSSAAGATVGGGY